MTETAGSPQAPKGGGPELRPASVVLVGGHESGGGSALEGLSGAGQIASVCGGGRALVACVAEALVDGPLPVVVVPMTLGRDPKLVADCARALRWAGGGMGRGRLALAPAFGNPDHLTAWLRTAAQRVVRSSAADRQGRAPGEPDRSALLVTAPAAGPYEDAELFRVARLARHYANVPMVEVAFDGGDPDPEAGADRCRRLGAQDVWLLRAAFAPPAQAVEGVREAGPLLAEAAVLQVVRTRVREALHRLDQGDDGVAAGSGGEHGRPEVRSRGSEAQEHVRDPDGSGEPGPERDGDGPAPAAAPAASAPPPLTLGPRLVYEPSAPADQ